MLTVRRGSLSEKYFAFVTDQVEEEPESKSQAKLNDKDQSKKSPGRKLAQKKGEKKEPAKVDNKISTKPRKSQICLTSNPSKTVLWSQIVHNVKEAERNELASFRLSVDVNENAEDSALSDSKEESRVIHIPRVVEIGLIGVFELIGGSSTSCPSLCCRALQALLNTLQGQNLEALKNEPTETLDKLFSILLQLSMLSPERNLSDQSDEEATSARQIPSLACSCLISLILAWGDTGKLLSAITAILIQSPADDRSTIKIPRVLVELQSTVLGSMQSSSHMPTPLQIGILAKSANIVCTVLDPIIGDRQILSVACDGTHLYCLTADEYLVKIGTGYNDTLPGHVYALSQSPVRTEEDTANVAGPSSSISNKPISNRLVYCKGYLYVLANDSKTTRVDCDSLSGIELSSQIQQQCSKEGLWFSEGDTLGHLQSSAKDTYVYQQYEISDDDRMVTRGHPIIITPVQTQIVAKGDVPNATRNHLDSVIESNSCDIVDIACGKDFQLYLLSSGHVMYTGQQESLGIKKQSKKPSRPALLGIPRSPKIKHISAAPNGDHALLVADTGEVFFVGTSSRGEDGLMMKSHRVSKPQKVKKMTCMESRHVSKCACNAGTSALIIKDGRLYLFGKDSVHVDSKSGFVSALKGVKTRQVALGKAHIATITTDGKVYTFGINNKGQCGRQDPNLSMAERIAEVKSEKDVSMPEEEKSIDDSAGPSGPGSSNSWQNFANQSGNGAPICSPTKHKWIREECRVCAVCQECTGYGSRCINSGIEQKIPGLPCGCGAGDSGCAECRCCKTCAMEADVKPVAHDNREHASTNVDADILKEASKIAMLPPCRVIIGSGPDASCKAIQVACGSHHTVVLLDNGTVYTFGHNLHGQLGLGDTTMRNQPCKVPFSETITSVAAGSYHTVMLTTSGRVFVCGRCSSLSKPTLETEKLEKGTCVLPKPLDLPPRALWIGASHDITFVKFDKLLLTPSELQNVHVMACSKYLILLQDSDGDQEQFNMSLNPNGGNVIIDQLSASCYNFSGLHQFKLDGKSSVCLDPHHNIMWSIGKSDWTIKSYNLHGSGVAFNQKVQTCTEPMVPMNPFSAQLAIPLEAGISTSRNLVALNLLSCIETLVKTCPKSGTKKMENKMETMDSNIMGRVAPLRFSQKQTDAYSVDEFTVCNRFKSNGGGWGYSAHSIEAIRFSCDTDIVMGGCGVFGGRGEYSVIIKVFEDATDSDGAEADGQLVAETDNLPYECGYREKFQVLFEEPVQVSAGQWYTISAKVTGPSSDCGSHGEQQVTTEDNIKFTFRRSKISNNGTDVAAGQIPELLYMLPPADNALMQSQDTELLNRCIKAQPITDEFHTKVTQDSLQPLLSLLKWAWERIMSQTNECTKSSKSEYSADAGKEHEFLSKISKLCFLNVSCLRLLRTNITRICSLPDNTAYGKVVSECSDVISRILTDSSIDKIAGTDWLLSEKIRHALSTSISSILSECNETFSACVDAFYPSPVLKWNQLNYALENYQKAECDTKPGLCRLLSVLFDSLSQPKIDLVQCLPLFPRALSNLQSLKSHMSSPMDSEQVFLSSVNQHQSNMLDQDYLNDISIGTFQDLSQSVIEILSLPVRNIGNGSSIAENSSSLLRDSMDALVWSASYFLVTLVYELCFKANEIPDSKTKAKYNRKNEFISVNRFSRAVANRCWNTGNGSPDAVCFCVSRPGVSVVGFGVYGGGGDHVYEMEIMQMVKGVGEADAGSHVRKIRWETLELTKGTYKMADCDANNIANIMFDKPVPLKENLVYAVRLHNHGERTYCGEQGVSDVKGQDGTEFRFTACMQSSNGTSVIRGQIPSILYVRQPADDEFLGSPNNDWIGTATTAAKSQATYQRHALNVLTAVSESAIGILNSLVDEDLFVKTNKVETEDRDSPSTTKKEEEPSSSLAASLRERSEQQTEIEKINLSKKILTSCLMSHLLPHLFEAVGILAQQSPQCAVDILGISRQLLPSVITAVTLLESEKALEPNKKEPKSPAKEHMVVVESDHPYKPAAFMQYEANLPDSVHCMALEFSCKCSTAQPEDTLTVALPLSNENQRSGEKSTKHITVLTMSENSNWPSRAVIVPGNKVVFSLATASDYGNNKDQKPELFYGFRCSITGFEMSDENTLLAGRRLISEITTAAGISCVTLMEAHEELVRDMTSSEDTIFPFSPSLPLLSTLSKEDLRECVRKVETAAGATLARHQYIFRYGLSMDSTITPTRALTGDLPLASETNEKRFLMDFISATPNTSGGRLARWLQPDSYVDPAHCELVLDQKSLVETMPIAITIITKDQYGHTVHVPALNVELSGKPLPTKDDTHEDQPELLYDISPNQQMPTFETQYETTKHRDSVYHSISMMRAYRRYSFEELRLLYPQKPTLKNESVLVASVGKGVYTATWIPVHASNYLLRVTFDRELKGPRKHVVVAPAPRGMGLQSRSGSQFMLDQNKRLRFAVENSRGLRVRCSPTLQSLQNGILKFNDVIDTEEELRNTDGLWVKLTQKSVEKYCKPGTTAEAWCLAYHNHYSKTLLVPEKQPKKLKENGKQDKDELTQPSPIAVSSAFNPFQPKADNRARKIPSTSKGSPIWGSLTPSSQQVADFKPGKYLVRKCGVSGHNIRCGPSLKSAPVGKLNLGDAITADEVAKVNIEIWLRLDVADVQKYCSDSMHCNDEDGAAWILAGYKDGDGFVEAIGSPSKESLFSRNLFDSLNGKSILDNIPESGFGSGLDAGTMFGKRKDESKVETFSRAGRIAEIMVNSKDFSEESPSNSTLEEDVFKSPISVYSKAESSKDEVEQPSEVAKSKPNSHKLEIQESSPSLPARGRSPVSPKHRPLHRLYPNIRSHSSPSHRISKQDSPSKPPVQEALKKSDGSFSAKDISRTPPRNQSVKLENYHSRSRSAGSVKTTPVITGINSSGSAKIQPKQRKSDGKNSSPRLKKTRSPYSVKTLARVDQKLDPSKEEKEKTIRGGSKRQTANGNMAPQSSEIVSLGQMVSSVGRDIDIPFIDELVDEEGNITSPSLSDVSRNDDVASTSQQSEPKKEDKKSDRLEDIRKVNESRLGKMAKPKWHGLGSDTKTSPLAYSISPQFSSTMETPEALSPLVAECSRAVFAAFLWHEGVVHDAMTCASYLKFAHTKKSIAINEITEFKIPAVPKRKRAHTLSSESTKPDAKTLYTDNTVDMTTKPRVTDQPIILDHLSKLWEEMSSTVTQLAIRNQIMPSPSTPKPNLNSSDNNAKSAKKMKVWMDARSSKKKSAEKKKSDLQQRGLVLLGGFSPQGRQVHDQGKQQRETKCELCDVVHPYPVTYHMKKAHKGCGKFASGLGYNSSGHYCGGWAGNCGDGGIGASTWYLLCIKCREKYSDLKRGQKTPQSAEKASKVNLKKLTEGHDNMQSPASAHQVMKDNALFLLELVGASREVPLPSKQDNFQSQFGIQGKQNSDQWQGNVDQQYKHDSNYYDCANLQSLPSIDEFPKIPCTYIQLERNKRKFDNCDVNRVTFADDDAEAFTSQSSERSIYSHHAEGDSTSQRRSRVIRSISVGSHSDTHNVYYGDSNYLKASSLLHQPSPAMQRLMQEQGNCNINTSPECRVSKSAILSFITQRHDLKSLRFMLCLTLRRASLRVHALEALNWLLCSVPDEEGIHDVLWYFVTSLSQSPEKVKDKEDVQVKPPDIQKPDKDANISLIEEDLDQEAKPKCIHPVSDLAVAGQDALKPVADAFHSFLQTVSCIMLLLPQNSRVQLMAIRCWSVRVVPSDHHFLHCSHVFSHISKILSKSDGGSSKGSRNIKELPPKSKSSVKIDPRAEKKERKKIKDAQTVTCSSEITSLFSIKPSSHDSIANSLTDGSTETFWESGDKDKNKVKHILLSADTEAAKEKEHFVQSIHVHIDNTRDIGKKVTSIAFSTEGSEEMEEIMTKEIKTQFAGWITCLVFDTTNNVKKILIDVKGPDNSLRVRQLRVLGHEVGSPPASVYQQKSTEILSQMCESELLRVFKLLTAEVFGQLLLDSPTTPADAKSNLPSSSNQMNKSVPSSSPSDKTFTPSSVPTSPNIADENLREHMVGILFSGSKLSKLQKQIFSHIVQAISVEASSMKLSWESHVHKTENSTAIAVQQLSAVVNDTYCFQLLSMVLALSGSDVGRNYVAKQKSLIKDFVSMLHTGTPRIQRQTCSLLKRILPEVPPPTFAEIMSAKLPPINVLAVDYIAQLNEAPSTDKNKASGSPTNGVLDILLLCVAKALHVQVKGHSTSHKGDSKQHSVLKIQDVCNKDTLFKDDSVWWMMQKDIVDTSIPATIIKLLTDMSKGQMGPAWKRTTKAYVAHTLISLTKLSETAKDPSATMELPITWKALAALCVLDQDHAVKLSSARAVQEKDKTLLKTNGGFLYDGNKVLVELECKNYKTTFEEEIDLSVVSTDMPYPVIHTSPFSVGGFAWQIRVFPNGPDKDNKGNVALFLHCTTSNHLTKVKARFLIQKQASPAVYEHTFPANCISEMPSGVAFPNQGQFMSTLRDNKLLIGIEFLHVCEVNEVHVTLSNSTSCPTVCVTPFEDLTGCPWVLKTLQAIKLKLKMDQNEKTTSGLMEFYHRHIMWNATLIAPGSEDVSFNVPLNTKGPLVGYFGENWSDADVIRSELSVEDLAISDNPYRTDVDDGYEKYSYITIHIDIVSNHLLYKTPAPSPTGDRERKLLFSARKERNLFHTRYQEILRQKGELESKLLHVTRERTLVDTTGNSKDPTTTSASYSRFLFDMMIECAERETSKVKRFSLDKEFGRPYVRPLSVPEFENKQKLMRYRENFSLLVADSRPVSSELATFQKEADDLHTVLLQFIEESLSLHITRIIESGSLGMNTVCGNRMDVDFIILSPDLPRNGHRAWMPSFTCALSKLLSDASKEGVVKGCTDFNNSPYSVQFTYNQKYDVDIYCTYDWNYEGAGGYDALYDELLRQRNSENLSWFCAAASERQKMFVLEQPDQVKDLIKVVKYWRNTVDWGDSKWIPPSYLLSLLLIRSYENACHLIVGSLPSNRTVIKCFVKLVLQVTDTRALPMKISWGRFYDPADYNIEYIGSMTESNIPIIQDPANPASNVAERPVSWTPFCKAVERWAHTLGLMHEGTLLPLESPRRLTCDNHDDGVTPAVIKCDECGNLCSDCDRFLHLHRRTKTHHRQLFKEEEQAIQVDLHEGCGRIKLYWLMALADSKTLKAVVEFRNRSGPDPQRSITTSGICRFCGNMSDAGPLAVGNVCEDADCQAFAENACIKVHPCGHLCAGLQNEEECLRCLQSSCTPGLKQDADDMCMICFTDALSNAPAIQLKCGHIFHYHCCKTQLEKRWTGPRMTFSFTCCSICKSELSHPSLDTIMKPIRALMSDVEQKALLRLEYEGLNNSEAITTFGGRFYNDSLGFALNKYAYYLCSKCNKAYYGGEVRCDVEAAAAGNDQFNPDELICGACSNVSCAQICPKHGTDFLEHKCRYCCSVAVYFCFGTTHFCQPCHDDFQRITAMDMESLPHCPAGPKTIQLSGTDCPLHVEHPSTGEEFALGCGVCRNAHTF